VKVYISLASFSLTRTVHPCPASDGSASKQSA
jgi:hypothetical protein